MREFQVRILSEVIFFAINSVSNWRDGDLLAPKIKIYIIFKFVIYCVESLTNQVSPQLIDWQDLAQRSSFDRFGDYTYILTLF